MALVTTLYTAKKPLYVLYVAHRLYEAVHICGTILDAIYTHHSACKTREEKNVNVIIFRRAVTSPYRFGKAWTRKSPRGIIAECIAAVYVKAELASQETPAGEDRDGS